MGFFNRKKKEQKFCPNCRMPVAEGSAFCDACGLRVTPPPSCGKCHLPLAPDTNFCEACGTPVGTPQAGSSGAPTGEGKVPEGNKKRQSAKGGKGKRKTHKKDEFVVPDMLTPESSGSEHTLVHPAPDPRETESAGSMPDPALPTGSRENIPATVPKTHSNRLAAAVLVLLAIILASAALFPLIHISVSPFLDGVTRPGVQSPGPEDTEPSISPAPSSEETPAGSSLVPGPTRDLPESLAIWLQAERDPVTNRVTVLFEGGKGQRGVRDILVRLTRSDGQVLTRVFRPLTVGEGADLQGTKYTDRLEVIVSCNNGEEYKVIDKTFEFKVRN